MTPRTPAVVLLAATAVLALAACAHSPAGAADSRRPPAVAGLGADSPEPSPDSAGTPTATSDDQSTATTTPTPSKTYGNGSGTGTGNGTGNGTGPQIVSFTATGAVCPVAAKPDAPYSQPGQVTIAWKISGADGVDLFMDQGLWRSYTGQQGSDTLPFACPDTTKANTHTYTLKVKNHAGVAKNISATAKPNP
jgi:hypothetical protein